MSFWKYAEKVSMCIGLQMTLDNIKTIHTYWYANRTIETVVNHLKEAVQVQSSVD